MVIVQPAVAETVVGFCMTGNHKVGVSILSFHQIISRQTAESLFYHGSSVHFIPHCKAVKCVSETAVQYILSVQIPMIRLQISGRTQNPFRFQITFRDDSGFKLENVNVVDHHLFIQDGTGIRFKGVIGIEKKQVFTSGSFHTGLPCVTGTAVVVKGDDADASVTAGSFTEQRQRIVGGAVIHTDDLYILQGLRCCAADAGGEVVRTDVVYRNYNRDDRFHTLSLLWMNHSAIVIRKAKSGKNRK